MGSAVDSSVDTEINQESERQRESADDFCCFFLSLGVWEVRCSFLERSGVLPIVRSLCLPPLLRVLFCFSHRSLSSLCFHPLSRSPSLSSLPSAGPCADLPERELQQYDGPVHRIGSYESSQPDLARYTRTVPPHTPSNVCVSSESTWGEGEERGGSEGEREEREGETPKEKGERDSQRKGRREESE